MKNFFVKGWRKQAIYLWIPLVSIILLLILFVIWLLIPGNRIYPNSYISELSEEQITELIEEENEVFIQQIERLNNSVENAVCHDDGTMTLPDGRTPFGILRGSNTEPSNNTYQVSPDSVLPAPPKQYVIPSNVPHNSNGTELSTLVDLIEETTVLILNPNGNARGSGFFIAPNLIVTNEHVVNGHDGDLFVLGKSFNHLMSAKFIASVGSSSKHTDDFALLEIPNFENTFLKMRIPSDSIQLNNIFAAGFPGDLSEYDTAFDKLLEGDLTAKPSVVITDGTVNAVTQIPNGDELIMHSASISFGDSGGPLLDTCGNLLGVNTFVQTGTIRSLYFALPTKRLVNFIGQHGVELSNVESVCEPQIDSGTDE